jgi:hypothetical protein
MAEHTSQNKNSHWSVEEETALLTFLIQHKAEAGDGCQFKATVWRGAAAELSKRPHNKGGLKTDKVCKNKWTKV